MEEAEPYDETQEQISDAIDGIADQAQNMIEAAAIILGLDEDEITQRVVAELKARETNE